MGNRVGYQGSRGNRDAENVAGKKVKGEEQGGKSRGTTTLL